VSSGKNILNDLNFEEEIEQGKKKNLLKLN